MLWCGGCVCERKEMGACEVGPQWGGYRHAVARLALVILQNATYGGQHITAQRCEHMHISVLPLALLQNCVYVCVCVCVCVMVWCWKGEKKQKQNCVISAYCYV